MITEKIGKVHIPDSAIISVSENVSPESTNGSVAKSDARGVNESKSVMKRLNEARAKVGASMLFTKRRYAVAVAGLVVGGAASGGATYGLAKLESNHVTLDQLEHSAALYYVPSMAALALSIDHKECGLGFFTAVASAGIAGEGLSHIYGNSTEEEERSKVINQYAGVGAVGGALASGMSILSWTSL